MAGNPHATHRYSDPELAEFNTLITSKLAQTREEVEKLEDQKLDLSESLQDNGYDLDENHGYADVEFLDSLINRQKKHIQDLEHALIRIKNKTYGICILSGQLIDKKRLLAVLTTTKSLQAKIAAQEEANKKISNFSIDKTPKPPKATGPKIITKIHRKPISKDLEKEGKSIKSDDDLDDDLETDLVEDGLVVDLDISIDDDLEDNDLDNDMEDDDDDPSVFNGKLEEYDENKEDY